MNGVKSGAHAVYISYNIKDPVSNVGQMKRLIDGRKKMKKEEIIET